MDGFQSMHAHCLEILIKRYNLKMQINAWQERNYNWKRPSDPRDKLLDNLENDGGPMIRLRMNFEHSSLDH